MGPGLPCEGVEKGLERVWRLAPLIGPSRQTQAGGPAGYPASG